MANPITYDEMISAGDGLYGALGELEKRIEHATSWRDFWGNLADQWIAYGDEAPRKMDGRASIYTGETYGEAHDRWSEYRATLVQRLGYDPDDDGAPCCAASKAGHEYGCTSGIANW